MEYYSPLCNYANSILRDENLAEDITQEVFLHLWENNETLAVKTKMKHLLFQSIKNKALEYIRSSKNKNNTVSLIDSMAYQKEDIEETAEKYMDMEALSKLMRHLPPKCKNVFALHRFNGLTYREIAEMQGISIKTVENHMLKAIKILRLEYAKTLN